MVLLLICVSEAKHCLLWFNSEAIHWEYCGGAGCFHWIGVTVLL